MKNELENKDSKILALNREIFIRNRDYDDDKENNGGVDSSKKRYSYNSNIINTVLNSENVARSLFKSNKKRKFTDLQNGYIPLHEEFSSKKKKI